MPWTLRHGRAEITLRTDLRFERGIAGGAGELRELFADPMRRSLLVEICSALGYAGAGASTQELVSRLVSAFERGALSVERTWLAPAPAAAAIAEEPAVRRAEAAPREEKTWIAVRLVNDADPPRPVAFERYRIELPDGSTRDGMLDANGTARIEGIDPGACRITFPALDGRRWSPA